jgi:ADP-ribosylglycohydrolase
MLDLKDKVRGMLYGVSVGDALGQPYENRPALGYPVNTFGGGKSQDVIDTVVQKNGLGRTTDDWQMTAVLARSLIRVNGFDIDDMAAEHVAAFNETTKGWGGGHRDSCAALKRGVSPSESGKHALNDTKPYRGRGNGMCMKISPLAAYHAVKKTTLPNRLKTVADLTMMTHATSIGLASAMGMEAAVLYCLKNTSDTFHTDSFLDEVLSAVTVAEDCVINERNKPPEVLSERIKHLQDNWHKMTPEDVSEVYKGGGYAYESFPFSLAFFCMGLHDQHCVYDCVGSGGDTDTNGSMVGALAGALHGSEIFPTSLLYKLAAFADIESLSGQFAEWVCKQ